jgi:hypothetical protein
MLPEPAAPTLPKAALALDDPDADQLPKMLFRGRSPSPSREGAGGRYRPLDTRQAADRKAVERQADAGATEEVDDQRRGTVGREARLCGGVDDECLDLRGAGRHCGGGERGEG